MLGSFGRRVIDLLVPGSSSSNLDKSTQVAQIDALITDIVRSFFEPFLDQWLEKDPSKKTAALEEVRGRIEQSIVTRLAVREVSSASVALWERMSAFHKRDLFERMLFELKVLFWGDEQRIKALPRWPLSKILSKIQPVIVCIACAIQDDIIVAPINYYFGIASMSDAAGSTLLAALDRIEVIRRYGTRVDDLKILRDIGQATRELKVQIARANGYVWLPLRSLITAPLSNSDLAALYARSKNDAEQLAHQIIGGDGIFLITGYRGVGKSTFINDALAMLPEIQREQGDEQPWHVVPIVVSLAKVSSVGKVLSLCIRKLYETLLNADDVQLRSLLTEKERRYLAMAYYRSAYNVNIQQGESVASLRHIEGQVGWDFKPAGFLPSTANSGLTSLIPVFGAGAKTSKDWNRQSSSTITLPDYDEDKAEEDIVQLIKMLARPRTRENMRIKLAFIFDEMDKMEVTEQEELTKELKNLFLERNTVFMLVTSKAFYDKWWDQRNVEDAVLASYFSYIKMVPLFTSQETTQLLKRLLAIDPAKLNNDEEEFIETFACHLTYRARGVPRDIIREIQGTQQWLSKGVQAFITDRMNQYPAVLAYAAIQRQLEGILDTTSTNRGTDPNGPAESVRFETGYAWLQKGRYEQIRRGLFLLVERLLDVEMCDMNPESEVFKNIRDTSFKSVAALEFSSLFNRLIKRLQSVRLRVGPGSPLARYYTPVQLEQLCITGTDLTFFSLDAPATAGDFQKFAVASLVYTFTGHSVVTTASPTPQLEGDISEQTIKEYLKKDGQVLPQIGLDALKQKKKPFSGEINGLLCCIFFLGQGTKVRLDAAALLQDTVLFDAVRDGDIKSEQINRFIELEVDERLLQEFLRLVQSGVSGIAVNSADGTAMVLHLLERYKAGSAQGAYPPRVRAFSESLLVDVVSTLAEIADAKFEVLGKVVGCLNPLGDLSDGLLFSLQSLETKSTSRRNLIELLVAGNFTGVSTATLRKILTGRDFNQLMQLWNYALTYKERAVAQRVLVGIMQQTGTLSPNDLGINRVFMWLNGSGWDRNDQLIIEAALNENPDLRVLLGKWIDTDKQNRIPAGVVASTLAPPLSPPRSGGNGWVTPLLTVLSAILMIAVYVFIPGIDLLSRTTLVYQVVARLLEMGWLYLGVGGLFCLLMAGLFWVDRPRGEKTFRVIMLIAGIILPGGTGYLLYFQITRYPLVVTFWGQTILIAGLVGIVVVPIVVWRFVRRFV